ncbi:MAG: R3H domain-containing nucleic acid-binding protein, partial [Chloroflexota bacterium]|nr:R3H domain-containing nucleic acid-binding protein [Chloroflexota bacterium]
EDLIRTGKSLLLLGRPGEGKTTMLREVARVLADEMKKRVIIVDTSNEIAGDGDIPHPAIGHARRMQVPTPRMQHAVMIEAVENHMPEVIVIDEIGTEPEAMAARTIAERGVQLVGTAHGNTLENLMMNPTLCDLIGGIQTVTLGDEEARRRGTQKSILERKAPPTFGVLVEIQSWDKVALHSDVAAVVDAILRGQASPAEVRSLDEKGEVKVEERANHVLAPPSWEAAPRKAPPPDGKVRRLYPFGISRSRLLDVVRDMQLPAEVVDSLREADVLITSKNYYRKRPPSLRAAESSGVPVYVLRSNTQTQLEQCLSELYGIESSPHAVTRALQEAEEAIREVMTHEGAVELAPQNAYVRRLQHRLAERYHVTSQSTGREPYRRVRIFKG